MTASLAGNFDEIHRDAAAPPPVAAASVAPSPVVAPLTSKWLLHPFVDYMLGCGGLVWLLFGLHYFVLGPHSHGSMTETLMRLSALGALFLGEGHTAATLVHTYRQPQLVDRFKFYTKSLPAIFLVLAGAGMCVVGLPSVLVKIYFLIVPHHFMAQAYGIARVYCMKQGYVLEDDERKAMLFMTYMTTLYAVVKQLAVGALPGSPTFLGQTVPIWEVLPAPLLAISEVLLSSSIVLFLALVIMRSIQSRKMFPLPALLTLATAILAFTMVQPATGIYWLYVSAFFHATQYLLTVLVSHWNETGTNSTAERLRTLLSNSSTSRMTGLTLLVSICIYIGIPRILESMGVNYWVATACIFTTMNMHHTAMDGFLWKLRRPEVRKAVIA